MSRFFLSSCFLALCASVFGFILKWGRHGWKLAIGISILLPCNLPSVAPVGGSQPEASRAWSLWGSFPCDMEHSRGRERKGPKSWHTLLGRVQPGSHTCCEVEKWGTT